jgi:hemolysin activation/secretion protein
MAAVVSWVAIAAGNGAQAQDLRGVQPQPAAPVAAPVTATAAQADYGVLRGVVVLADPAQLQAGGAASAGIDTGRAGALPRQAMHDALAPFLGQELDLGMLQRMRSALAEALVRAGERFTRVTLPPQEVPAGVVQLVVLRGQVGEVSVAGARWFGEATYRNALRARPGQPLDGAALDADVDWFNRANPFRRMQLVTKPGAKAGDVDVVLQATERRPWQVYAGYNNTGTDSTGMGRVFAGFSWGNAFGLGHQLGYQHTHSADDPDLFRSDAVNYTIPLPWRHLLTASASAGHVRSRLPAPLDQRGASSAIGLRYAIPFDARGGLRQELAFSLDYKRSDNNLLFAQVPVFGSITETFQASAGYSGSVEDGFGSTAFDATLVLSPGGVFDHDNDADYQDQRSKARARYAYLNFGATRTTRLPRDFTLVNRLRAQVSSGNLLGSEQLSFGGTQALRGYLEGQAYADEGVILRTELRAPAGPLGAWFGSQARDQVQPYVFLDQGEAYVHSPIAGEREKFSLASAGVGLDYTLGDHLDIAFDHGWQLQDPGLGPRRRTHHGEFSLTLTW